MLMADAAFTRAAIASDPRFAARTREFARLDDTDLAYLDYTGSALPAACQLRLQNDLVGTGVYANPHADSVPSRRSTAVLQEARSLLLAHLDADPAEYTVCFTANATAAIKLVAESYPFAPNGAYVLTADNHNSVNGVREYARRAGARVAYVPLDDDLRAVAAERLLADVGAVRGRKLFAFPAQSISRGCVTRSISLRWRRSLDSTSSSTPPPFCRPAH